MATKETMELTGGQRVVQKRRSMELTQDEVGELSGIDRAHISRIEAGATIGRKRAQKLAAAFGEADNWRLYVSE
jgi:transcriptional regulator with XRE-family HTH domain